MTNQPSAPAPTPEYCRICDRTHLVGDPCWFAAGLSGVPAPDPSDVAIVLRGFAEGVFVRSTANDGDPGWAIKLFPYLRALAKLQESAAPAKDQP